MITTTITTTIATTINAILNPNRHRHRNPNRHRPSRYPLLYFAGLLVFMLILPAVMADPELYATGGVSRDNTYDQDGTGVWAGRTPTTYTRTVAAGVASGFPVVGDVDADGRNEIIVIEGNALQILNFTSGVGLLLEQTITQGYTTIATDTYYVTPYLFTVNSSSAAWIITTNMTHVLAYNWNGSAVVLNRSVATSLNMTAVVNQVFKYPVIKCAPGNMWNTSRNTCVFPVTNRTGAVAVPTFIFYDLDLNTLIISNATSPANGDTSFRSTHLFDGDSDGFLEAYFSRYDAAAGDLFVNKVELSPVASVQLIQHNLAANRPFTDIILTRLNGFTPSVTWGFSSDAVNYDAYTINANTGAAITASYCSVLSCPEGDWVSANMFMDDGTYGDYSGDVCYYLRNYAQTDPAANTDTIMCVSEYAGSGFERNNIANNANFSFFNIKPVIHEVPLTGVQGVLTPAFLVQGTTKETNPALPGTDICIPVDAQKSGSLDIICSNASRIQYHDDAYTNQQVSIDAYQPDTGNSICTGETLTTALTISDAESDAGNCWISVTYANGTVYGTGNYSNTTFASGASSVSLYFTAATATVLNLLHTYSCTDQYHTAPDTVSYAVTYSNYTCGSGMCKCKGEGAPLPITTTTATANETDIMTGVFDAFGFTATKTKNIIGIAVVIGVMVTVAAITTAPFVIAGAGLLTVILVTIMGLLSAYILVLILVAIGLLLMISRFVTGGGAP